MFVVLLVVVVVVAVAVVVVVVLVKGQLTNQLMNKQSTGK